MWRIARDINESKSLIVLQSMRNLKEYEVFYPDGSVQSYARLLKAELDDPSNWYVMMHTFRSFCCSLHRTGTSSTLEVSEVSSPNIMLPLPS
jgi:hypothetical protein